MPKTERRSLVKPCSKGWRTRCLEKPDSLRKSMFMVQLSMRKDVSWEQENDWDAGADTTKPEPVLAERPIPIKKNNKIATMQYP